MRMLWDEAGDTAHNHSRERKYTSMRASTQLVVPARKKNIDIRWMWLLVGLLGLSSLSAAISGPQKQALVDLYAATGGPSWITTWDLTAEPCTFYGVTCNDDQSEVT